MKYKVLLSPKENIKNEDIVILGSKSYTNRAILIASISNGISKISNLLRSDDTKYMIDCLKNLGIKIEDHQDYLVIHGNNGNFDKVNNSELFCGIAGTTSRFITGLSLLVNQELIITGEGKILERPISDLVDAISIMGVKIEYLKKQGSLPLKINAQKNIKNEVTIDGETSSQFISALLMVAPRLENGLIINIIGNQVSKPYIDITIDIMQKFGVIVENDNYKRYSIKHQEYISQNYVIEGDWSSASYFCAISGLVENKIKIHNIYQNSIQGDAKLIDILKLFNISFNFNSNIATLEYNNLKISDSIEIDMEKMPDTAMTIMVLASILCHNIKINGLSTLKDKECDRIEMPKKEFLKLGIKCITTTNSIQIYGQTFNNNEIIEIDTFDDHRMAMAFSLFGAKRQILINDAQVVNKSFPNYWEELAKIMNVKKIYE